MKKIFLFLSLIAISFFPLATYGAASNQKIAKVYSNLAQKLDLSYSLQRQISIFEELADALSDVSERKLSGDTKRIVSELERHNNNYLLSLYSKQDLESPTQKALELQERLRLKNSLSQVTHPSYIQDLQNTGKTLYTTNNMYDFVEGDTLKKIRFSRFYELSSSSVRQFYNSPGIIVATPETGEYKFVQDYSFEEKIPYSKLQNIFGVFITPETNYTLENNVYYGYIFRSFNFLEDSYGVFLQDLERLNLTDQNAILYRDDDGRYNFVTDYTKRKLIRKDILDGVADQHMFLQHVRDDKRELSTETDGLFQVLQQTTKELTTGKTREEKIATIYDWILNHVQYTTNIDLEDEKIFSGIDTYKNADGVCTGYSKLMSYMLMFAGIHGSQVIRGDVIDAQDFPQIGHAWVKIDDKYFDPTFDDPVGATENKNPSEYKYYNMPREVFYTNRYDRGDTPESYKSLSLSARETIVARNLYDISTKYATQNYNILQGAIFRKQNNISYDTLITPQVLSGIIPVYSVDGNTFSFTENGNRKTITSLRYYVIDENTTQSALSTINYNLEDIYLFLWDGAEYRLSYDVSLR